MAREYFCAYHSLLETTEVLSDAEFGRLMRAAIEYSASGILPSLGGRESIMWGIVKWQIDRDVAHYEKVSEARRSSGSKGGKQKVANCSKAKQKVANATNDNDNDNPPKSPQGDAEFDLFWAAYPRRVAKDKARTAFSKIPRSEIPALMAALERHKKSDQWTRDGGQYIPHPTTWLNQKRWQDEIPGAAKASAPQAATSVKASIPQWYIDKMREEYADDFR